MISIPSSDPKVEPLQCTLQYLTCVQLVQKSTHFCCSVFFLLIIVIICILCVDCWSLCIICIVYSMAYWVSGPRTGCAFCAVLHYFSTILWQKKEYFWCKVLHVGVWGEDRVRVEGDPSQILTQLSPLIHSTIVFIVIFTCIVLITIVNIIIRSDKSSPPSIHSIVMIIYVIIFLKVVITLLLKTQLYPSLSS